MATTSFLTPTQRYAAGALFALALHQAQINQTRPLGSSTFSDEETADDRTSNGSSSDSVAGDPDLWVHELSGLYSVAWSGLEETAGSSPAKPHVGAFLRLLAEENDGNSSQNSDQELALSRAVDAMWRSMEEKSESSESKKEKHCEYESECREKCSTAEVQSNMEAPGVKMEVLPKTNGNILPVEDAADGSSSSAKVDENPIEEVMMLGCERQVTVLYVLLLACLADTHEHNKKCTHKRKGYDAWHRVALQLLTTWLDVKWIKMEDIETMVACSAMALAKKEESNEEQPQSSDGKWAEWKHGGIIGAAALTGGTLMAITGGLAAPETAPGLRALAPTLGTLIPVIGASEFAATTGAAGTVARSVSVAASFGAAGAGLTGSKMARRTGNVDEFAFKAIGEITTKEYVLQWESKNVIAVSTAIQDWLTSRIALELMKQGATKTVLSTLLAALAWPAALLIATDFIDSNWMIAIDRSDKAGRLLAEGILREQVCKPVTLVGYSLGARVIFKCLQFLAETENNAELVEKVVLLGAPISIKDENCGAARKMVARRFVNAYSTNDWMLGVAFQACLLTQGLAGIQPIDVPGIENVDVTDLIEGHSSYLWTTQHIIELLDLDTYHPVFRGVAKRLE